MKALYAPAPNARGSGSSTTRRPSRSSRVTAASPGSGCGARGRLVDLRAKAGRTRLRRLPSQCRDESALPRAGLGPGKGARLALQHGPRAPDGARHRRRAGRALVGQRNACAWDLNAPPVGDLDVGDRFQKHGYTLYGIVVNAKGERFLDEGLDFHSYTYAKYGGEILKQPGMFAWQVSSTRKTVHLLRDEYRIPRTTKEKADTLEALAGRLEGVDGPGFLETVRAFNAAPRPDVAFNPNVHDGLRTGGLAIDKTNWAQRLDTPPYEAYGVTTGITFTFGGLEDHQRRRGRGRHRNADPRPFRRRREWSAGSSSTTTRSGTRSPCPAPSSAPHRRQERRGSMREGRRSGDHDVGPSEIVALEQQRHIERAGAGISETIAHVERCGMPPPSVSLEGLDQRTAASISAVIGTT